VERLDRVVFWTFLLMMSASLVYAICTEVDSGTLNFTAFRMRDTKSLGCHFLSTTLVAEHPWKKRGNIARPTAGNPLHLYAVPATNLPSSHRRAKQLNTPKHE
jgi:hypothetical protein